MTVRLLDFDRIRVLKTGHVPGQQMGWEFRLGDPETLRAASIRVGLEEALDILELPDAASSHRAIANLLDLVAKRVGDALADVAQ